MGHNKTILVFDKYEFERDKIKSIFKFVGDFDIIEISSLNEYMIVQNKLRNISLIIFDIEFPTIKEGFQLLEYINENILLQETPIIICTRNNSKTNKTKSLKYSVLDYILKPYDPKRLEKSIRILLNDSIPIKYHFNKAGVITVSIEEFIEKELKMSNRSNKELSILLITPFSPKLEHGEKSVIFKLWREKIYEIAIDTIRKISRITDTIILNDNKDILILLPCTNTDGAYLVNEKISKALSQKLKDFEIEFKDILCSEVVTYPTDGDSIDVLMSNALIKLSEKFRLFKISSLHSSKLNTIQNAYKKYQ